MEGGMIENTVKQMRRIYTEEGRQQERQKNKKEIQEIAKKLKEKGMKTKDIEIITKLPKSEIQKI